MNGQRATYSTGILRKPPRTKFALADVVNLNAARSALVTVRVFDWSSGSPVPLAVNPCGRKTCTLRVGPGKSVFLFADVSKVRFKYEVRIVQPVDRKVISNVTGVTNAPFTPQPGDTVLQNDLIRIK